MGKHAGKGRRENAVVVSGVKTLRVQDAGTIRNELIKLIFGYGSMFIASLIGMSGMELGGPFTVTHHNKGHCLGPFQVLIELFVTAYEKFPCPYKKVLAKGAGYPFVGPFHPVFAGPAEVYFPGKRNIFVFYLTLDVKFLVRHFSRVDYRAIVAN
jgi:hypothetical protein